MVFQPLVAEGEVCQALCRKLGIQWSRLPLWLRVLGERWGFGELLEEIPCLTSYRWNRFQLKRNYCRKHLLKSLAELERVPRGNVVIIVLHLHLKEFGSPSMRLIFIMARSTSPPFSSSHQPWAWLGLWMVVRTSQHPPMGPKGLGNRAFRGWTETLLPGFHKPPEGWHPRALSPLLTRPHLTTTGSALRPTNYSKLPESLW